MKKRGMSHIEVFLAFIIFLSTLFGALYFFNPEKGVALSEKIADDGLDALQEKTSVNLLRYSVMINNRDDALTPGDDRISHQKAGIRLSTFFGRNSNNALAFDADNSGIGIKARIKDKASDNDEDVYCLQKEDSNGAGINWNDREFVHLYIGDASYTGQYLGQEGADFNCENSDDLLENQYSAASLLNESFVSEKKIKELKSRYETSSDSYSALKSSMGIPRSIDFSFTLSYENSGSSKIVISTERKKPRGLQVLSKTKRVKILREDGKTFSFGDISISTW